MLLDEIDNEDKENSSLNGDEDESSMKDFIAKEKAQLKELEKKIEEDKRKYK
jgi:hypothetical protein